MRPYSDDIAYDRARVCSEIPWHGHTEAEVESTETAQERRPRVGRDPSLLHAKPKQHRSHHLVPRASAWSCYALHRPGTLP